MQDVFDISMRIRILRSWQESNAARPSEFSERDLLILEIISQFGPVTETELRTILGMSPSLVSQVIKQMTDRGLVTKQSGTDARCKPLGLTTLGTASLKNIREKSAKRYEFLLAKLTEPEQKHLALLVQKISQGVSECVNQEVFNR